MFCSDLQSIGHAKAQEEKLSLYFCQLFRVTTGLDVGQVKARQLRPEEHICLAQFSRVDRY